MMIGADIWIKRRSWPKGESIRFDKESFDIIKDNKIYQLTESDESASDWIIAPEWFVAQVG